MTNNVPERVRKQAEEAQKLHERMYDNKDTSSTEATLESNEHVDVNTNKDTTDKANPTPDIDKKIDDGYVAPDEESLEEKYRKLEAAHKTLQGKYRAEVPRINEQVRTLTQQLSQAKQDKATAEKSAETANAELGDVTARLENEIGEEASVAITDYTQQMINTELDKRQDKKDPQVKPDDAASNQFMKDLNTQIPNFDAVNNSKAFIEWLKGTDPETGMTYSDGINQAGTTFDLFTVIDITKQFIRAQKQLSDAPAPGKLTPDDYVAAPKGRKRETIKETPNYTVTDYENLQKQIQRGEWKGKEAEARALEETIHAVLTGS